MNPQNTLRNADEITEGATSMKSPAIIIEPTNFGTSSGDTPGFVWRMYSATS
jgi:hypothetical protein